MSSKEADRSGAIQKLLGSINLSGDDFIFHSTTHHQVNLGQKNLAKYIVSVEIDAQSLGNIQRAKPNKKINIALSRPEVVSEGETKDKQASIPYHWKAGAISSPFSSISLEITYLQSAL